MSETLQSTVVVRYDPGLRSITGEPAECAVTYEHVAGADPQMVVTFGDAMPGDHGWLPFIMALRATVAPGYGL